MRRSINSPALLFLSIAMLLAGACPGSIDRPSDAEPDSDVSTTICGGIDCPVGTECIDERCVPIGPCTGVVCEGVGEVCIDGRCVSGAADEDNDGFPIIEDCDDTDDTVYPGVARPCRSECGDGTEVCGDDGMWGPCEPVCDLPHAESSCVDGTCVVTVCEAGWSDCDEHDGNGCEVLGECGVTCSDALDCVRACATDQACQLDCIDQVCPESEEAAADLYNCAVSRCEADCIDAGSSSCEACVVTSCGDDYNACLGAEC